jgi:hypothetical protein
MAAMAAYLRIAAAITDDGSPADNNEALRRAKSWLSVVCAVVLVTGSAAIVLGRKIALDTTRRLREERTRGAHEPYLHTDHAASPTPSSSSDPHTSPATPKSQRPPRESQWHPPD